MNHPGEKIFEKESLIDCHVHTGLYPFYDLKKDPKEDLNILSISDYPLKYRCLLISHFKSILYNFMDANKELVNFVRMQKGYSFALISIHPYQTEALKELKRWYSNPFVAGVKLHGNLQQLEQDSPHLFSTFECAAELGFPILLHCGSHHAITSLERILNWAEKHPRTIFIIGHLGGNFITMAESLLGGFENVYAETSITRFFGDTPSVLKDLSDRILYGSDYPCGNPYVEATKILTLGLTQEELEKLFYKNAMRIFQRVNFIYKGDL